MLFALILGAVAGGVCIPIAGVKVAAIVGLAVFIYGARRRSAVAAQDAVVIYQYTPDQTHRRWF